MLKACAIITMILTTLAMLALACVEIVGLHEIVGLQRDTIRSQTALIQRAVGQNEDLIGWHGGQPYEITDLPAEAAAQAGLRVVDATVTSYSPHRKQTDNDPHVAASMRRVREGTVAVSRDLFWAGWTFGRRVYIEGHGVFEINDLMNARFERRIDVFRWDKGKAKEFGMVRTRAALLE